MRALLLCLLPLPALAETPMSGAEFEAYTTGKTLSYGTGAEPYGVERYHENRRVTWAFVGGDCIEGEWYEPEPGMICFAYPDLEPEQCWRFFEEEQGLRAEFVNDPALSTLFEVSDTDLALICPGYGV